MPAFDKSDILKLYDQIEALDEQLDEASGGEAAGKRKIAKEIAEATAESWEKIVNTLMNSLRKIEDVRVLSGAYTGVRSALHAEFNKAVDAYVTTQVPEKDPNAVEIPDAEITKIAADRKELVAKFNLMRELLEAFDEDVSDVPVPRVRRGGHGKRGPRVLVDFEWSVDGKPRGKTTNNLSSIANTVTGPEITNTQQLREWLAADPQNLDLQNPPDEFSFTLPNGKVLAAVKKEGASEGEPEDDFEEDFEDEEEMEEAEV